VVYFIPYVAWTLGNVASWNGKTMESLADFGTTVAVAAIFAANIYVGINTRYWTVLTWVVVIGSSIVMLLWIVIYSFFQSSDFNDEVVILFGNVQFWSTVVVSVLIALAPRFLIKFISTSYFPLDRDIVREQWVLGDLKDRLGIQRRKDRKGRDVEAAPMFHQPHARSLSEVSVVYEPALTRSPGDNHTSVEYSDDTPPPTIQQKSSPLAAHDSGELIAVDPSSEASSHLSNSPTLRNRLVGDRTPPLAAGSSSVSRTSPPHMRQLSSSAYEMQVRDHPPPRVKEASDTSYRTADSAWPDDPARSRPVSPNPPADSWRRSEARAL